MWVDIVWLRTLKLLSRAKQKSSFVWLVFPMG